MFLIKKSLKIFEESIRVSIIYIKKYVNSLNPFVCRSIVRQITQCKTGLHYMCVLVKKKIYQLDSYK